MKTVTDFPAFAETAQLLADLTNERDALNLEQSELWAQLRYDNPNQGGENLTTEEAARRLADGGDLPRNNADRIRAASGRELIVRQRLEAINKVLRDLPQILEGHRRKARAEQITGELAGDVEKIKADFEKARKTMLAACLAETKLIDRLIVAGFGGNDAWLTTPHWLNRNLLIEEATHG
jgi:hypothetical protein